MDNFTNTIRGVSYLSTGAGEEDFGCAYVVEEPDGRRSCGAPRKSASSYCTHHHSLCRIACGTKAETDRLQALATAVGGRRARQRAEPTRQFLNRLEQAVRENYWPKRSCYVFRRLIVPNRIRRQMPIRASADIAPTQERRTHGSSNARNGR